MSTINDVALESGVSITTVSTVLNNAARPVKAETRQRVLAAANRLKYHPNAMASGLVRRRMDTLGILSGVFAATDVVTDSYAAGVLQGVLSAAADKGFHVTLFTKFWEDSARSAGMYRDRRTDGIVIIAPGLDSDMVCSLSALGVVVVTIAAAPSPGICCVDVDNAFGARLATEHLLSLGHTRIAHITGNVNQHSVHERRQAFTATMEERGSPTSDPYVISAMYDGTKVEEATRQLLSLSSPPTAIFAGNDAIGRRVVETATALGVQVPQDLSVVGFDDSIHASLTTPSLTTVRQPLKEIGALAANTLIDRINGRSVPEERHLIAPQLIIRGTTSPVKDSALQRGIVS